MEDGKLTIGQLAKRIDLNPRTVRYYESVGILPDPERSESGYRLYSEADVHRVRFVRSARQLGFKLGEIKETLALRDRDEPPCGYVRAVIDQRLGEIDEQLRGLRAFQGELRRLRERMQGRAPGDDSGRYCHYIETAADG
jgi:DNA-binding transcriptional MerR regulator